MQSLSYFLLRFIGFPISFLSYRKIHKLGGFLGTISYYLAPKKVRKVAMNNLALAKHLSLTEKEMKEISKKSFQNLIILGLEYFRLRRSRHKFDKLVEIENLDLIEDFHKSKQGAVIVTGHIGNWEIGYLACTQLYPHTAIGRPIKNKKLYRFIQSLREMHGGQVIHIKGAMPKGVKTLKSGNFFSIVNDQAYVSSSYSYPFFGQRAWTSTAPALLAYKANVPILLFNTIRLENGKYKLAVSDPIWPNCQNSLKKEVIRLMDQVMKHQENHIIKYPSQWLWQHRRWKQGGNDHLYKKYRADNILFVMPFNYELFKKVMESFEVLLQLYPKSFLTFMVPAKFKDQYQFQNHDVIFCKTPQEALQRDYRFQIVYDFEQIPSIKRHYLKLGAFSVYTHKDLLGQQELKKESFGKLLKEKVTAS